MDESSVYKVITLKELIAQVYTQKTGFPSKACVSKAKAFYNQACTPDSKPGEEEPRFEDFLDAHNYFMSYANYKFVAEQTPIPNMNNGYAITVTRDGKREPDFKFINSFRLW